LTPPEHSRLRDQTKALEVDIAERTRELALAVKEMESFTYSVAHDLRAPVRAINGFSRALLEDYGEQFVGEPLDYLLRISRASERMGQLIDDLLKLSQVGRGDVDRQDVDLSLLAAGAAARLAERLPDRDVRLAIQDGMTTRGDGRLLLIVLENLLDNAWKFTRRRETAEIRFFAEDEAGRRVFRIADNGSGFDMRYRHKLFAPFQRLHRNDEFEGTGIGLVIVSRILARHGGDVWIDGIEEQGATVSFTLPERS
jgi:light-regulated signal transduction histidine kinase (bacteriophytochrome)